MNMIFTVILKDLLEGSIYLKSIVQNLTVRHYAQVWLVVSTFTNNEAIE